MFPPLCFGAGKGERREKLEPVKTKGPMRDTVKGQEQTPRIHISRAIEHKASRGYIASMGGGASYPCDEFFFSETAGDSSSNSEEVCQQKYL